MLGTARTETRDDSQTAWTESRGQATGVFSVIGNIIWVVLAGWWLVIAHVTSAVALAITIIGIPFAWANLKMVPVALLPLGKQIVDQP